MFLGDKEREKEDEKETERDNKTALCFLSQGTAIILITLGRRPQFCANNF